MVNQWLTDRIESHGSRRNESGIRLFQPPPAKVSTRFLTALRRHAEQFLAGAEQALVTRERHRRALEETLAALRRALAPTLAGREDLLAEELRAAAQRAWAGSPAGSTSRIFWT